MRWLGRSSKDKHAPAGGDAAPEARDTTGPEPSGANVAEVRAYLREQVAALSDEKLRPEEIDTGAALFDCGYVDSLSSVSLLEMIRERYGVEVAEVELVGRLNTLDALAQHVAAASPSAS